MAPDLGSILAEHATHFHPVVPFDPKRDKMISVDLTASSKTFPLNVVSDHDAFVQRINEVLNAANARYATGGYNELREVYAVSTVFDNSATSAEPRRLHLGVDIWGKPNTAVYAPVAGVVHSFAFNDRPGDYGATLILTHQLSGVVFYTLYGHLSLNSIKNLQEGARIEKGDVIGEFGIPAENGHWPPHLHFQIISDLEGWRGDYPGVCAVSEKEKYLHNCPDPELILGIRNFTAVQ